MQSFPKSKFDEKSLQLIQSGSLVQIVQVKSKNGWTVSQAILAEKNSKDDLKKIKVCK
jgi:hypothetical protein